MHSIDCAVYYLNTGCSTAQYYIGADEADLEGFNVIEKAVEAHVANEHHLLVVLEKAERQVLAQVLRKLLILFKE